MGSVGNTFRQQLLNTNGTQKIRTSEGFIQYTIYDKNSNPFIYLDELKVAPDMRGMGKGTQLLEQVKTMANKANMPIELDAFPIGAKSMSIEDLVNWYEKRGFVHQGANKMIYAPKRK